MGSVGGKTSIEPKVYSSLTFGELSKIILMFNLGDRINE
jgi:hypothetical protein